MKISLESLIGITDEVLAPKEDNSSQKLAESIKDVKDYINKLQSLAKIACFQNEFNINTFTKKDEEKLEKIGSVLPLSLLEDKDSDILVKVSEFFEEFANLNKKKEIEKLATEATAKLIGEGFLVAEDVIEKLSTLKEKTIEDLTILNKALDLHKQGEFLSIGSISEESEQGSYSARDKFISDLLN